MFKKKMAVAVAADVPVSTVSDPGKTEQFSVWNCIKGYLYIPFAIAWSPLRIWSEAISLCSTATTKAWN